MFGGVRFWGERGGGRGGGGMSSRIEGDFSLQRFMDCCCDVESVGRISTDSKGY